MNQFAAIGCLTTLVTVTASAVPVTVPRTDFARSNVAYVSGSDVRQFTGLTALQDAKSAAVGGNTIFVGPKQEASFSGFSRSPLMIRKPMLHLVQPFAEPAGGDRNPSPNRVAALGLLDEELGVAAIGVTPPADASLLGRRCAGRGR